MSSEQRPRIVMDVCRDGWTGGLQLGIAALDEGDHGDGYRIAGPKYNGSQGALLSADLDERDAREIRGYLDRAFPSGGMGELAEVERLRAELTAERKRAAELRDREASAHEQLAAAVGVASVMVWPDLVARVAELAARPTRVDVLREASQAAAHTALDMYEKGGVYRELAKGAGAVAGELERMADADEQGETGGVS